MITGYQEFEEKLLKRRGKKVMKITNSWGVYDAYKHIRKNKWFNIGRPLKEGEFYSIIRGVNNLLADEVSLGNTCVFPMHMGRLELTKVKKGVSIVNGKLRVTYPINWPETLKLWYSDKEERERKTLIRYEDNEVLRIKYSKRHATYNNLCYYGFDVGNALKKRLRKNIIEGKAETLW